MKGCRKSRMKREAEKRSFSNLTLKIKPSVRLKRKKGEH